MKKTIELEETVQNLRAALTIVHEHVPWPSDDNTVNSPTTIQNLVQEDIKRFKQRMKEDIDGIKREMCEQITDIKSTIRKEVKDQCESKVPSPELKRPKTQHKGADAEGVLDHVLKTSGEALGVISTLETKIHRVEMNLQNMSNVPTQISSLEERTQQLIHQCKEEIENRFKDQIDHFERMISNGIQKRVQQNIDSIEKQITAEVFKVNDAMMKQYRKDNYPADHKQCDAHEKKDGIHTGCCHYCTDMFRQVENEIQQLSYDMSEHMAEFNTFQTFVDGVGRMFNPLKEQIEAMKVELHVTGFESRLKSSLRCRTK